MWTTILNIVTVAQECVCATAGVVTYAAVATKPLRMKGEAMTYSDFTIGRTVRLNSGGSTMTISSAPEQTAEGYRVETTWIDGSGKVCKAWFLIAMLELEFAPWTLGDWDDVA